MTEQKTENSTTSANPHQNSDTLSSPLMNTYSRLPIAFTKGDGPWLYDDKQNRYFDAISGIAVCGLGHSHPKITARIQEQAALLIHNSNLYHIPSQLALGKALTKVSGLEAAFFCNSGAEANEAALKIARAHGHSLGIKVPHVIVMENAFHGRTLATLSASGSRKIQAGFEPLVSGFIRVPYNNIMALKEVAEKSQNNIAAILVEPVQGEGGVHVLDTHVLQAMRELCDANNWLLMMDEVQSGNGRTGKYFAYQHADIIPDVVTTAKGLGNGVPIGACLTNQKANLLFKPGSHGSTYGGNPLCCAAALSVVETLVNENLIERAQLLGERILAGFVAHFDGADYITDIRGKGLMIGIELKEPCNELVSLAQAKGLLINITSNKVIRLLPPLIMTDEQADDLVQCLARLIKVYAGDDRMLPR